MRNSTWTRNITNRGSKEIKQTNRKPGNEKFNKSNQTQWEASPID
jgi:hypothetical protein